MEAIRTIQTVKEGRVHLQLPKQFWGRQVEIIVLSTPRQENRTTPQKKLRGCLHQYANPKLIEREKEAWRDAVSEKYGNC